MIDQTGTILRCSLFAALLLGISPGLEAQSGTPAAIAVLSGSGQRTSVGELFPNLLVALVTDASGNPVPNAIVSFAGPNAQGAPACDFLGTFTPTISVSTGPSGLAAAPCFANPIAGGPYTVAATVTGAPGAANFSLTNFPSTAVTTTVVTSSTAASTLGQPLTLTATVTPAGATGTVTFSFGTMLAGTATLNAGGQATLITALLPAGANGLTAVYSGDATHLASTAPGLFQTVSSVPASGFAPAVNFALGTGPGSTVTGDFNGDGIADMASVSGGNQITVLLGNGSGGFAPAPGSPFAVPGAQAIAVGDFNGDGKADLAIAENTGNAIAVLFGNGSGGFTQGPVFSLADNASPVALAVADFNGDGIADLAVADSGTNDVAVLLGNGAGGFTQAPGSPFPAGQTPSSVAVGDFNTDGLPDVAVASTGSNDVTILLGAGAGEFTPAQGSPVPADGFPSSMAVADFNGDGIPDLAVANASGGDVTVILGSSFGALAEASWSPVAVGQAPYSITAGDFNGDGNIDFAVANYGIPGAASVYLGNGNGGFNDDEGVRRHAPSPAVASRRKRISDFTPAPEGPVSVGGNPVSIAAADFNSDGKTDLAVVNSNDNNVSVLLGVQSPTLTINAACPAPVAVEGQFPPYSFTISASGGVFPLTWTLTGGQLPDDLGLNPATGVISGFSFNAGTFPITVTVSDSGVGPLQQSATYQCSIVSTLLPVISAAPSQISFTSVQGATPPAQSLNVSSVGESVAFTAAATVNAFSGAPWLGVAVVPPGTTNQRMLVKVLNPAPGAPAGVYTGDVTLSAPLAYNPTTTVPVNWTVIQLLAATAACPAMGGIQGLPYSLAVGASGGSPPYNWALTSGPLPAGLTLNTATGVISGTPSNTGVFPITVQIMDSGRGTLQQSAAYKCSIAIASQFAVTSACPATGGIQGSAYSFAIGVVGGSPPYNWMLTGGALPAGLTLNTATGVISGTPVNSGTFPIVVQIRDSGVGTPQQSGIYQCSLVIAPQLLITATCPALSGAQGSPYSFVVGASGGTPTYTWALTSGSLPPGLQLNSLSGLISGVPTTPGTFPFAISITDSGVGPFRQTVTYACRIVITPPGLGVASGCPGNGIVGATYGPFYLSASGGLGAGSYIFSITNGSLPTGVTLQSNLIGGTPGGPPGTSNFSIQVTSGSQTASTACSVTIAPALPALQITGTCPANSVAIGSAVSVALSAAGGKPPYTFRLSSGPSWLTLTSQGNGATLTGTPPAAGAFPFSVTLTDSVNSKPAVFSCTIATTSSALKIDATCPGPQVEEVAFSIPLGASGGQGPYNWRYSGPGWLQLASATGATNSLSGTPPRVTASQTFPFTVTLTDSANSAPVTFTCSVIVNPPPLQIQAAGSCPTAPLARPTKFSNSFTASGGQLPYAWSLAGPSWLVLGASAGPTTSISGTPAADGSYPFTLTLQDSAKTTPAIYTCMLTVSTPIPPPKVTTGPAPATLLDSLTGSTLSLDAATPVILTGTIQLSFTADAFGVIDNPQVQFSPPGQGRTFNFTMAAGSETVTLPDIQQGTVAGTIHVELVSLLDGTRDVLPVPHPAAEYLVARMAPVIVDNGVTVADQTSTGFTVVIAGYSSPRDMSSVNLTFTPASGASVNGTSQFTIDVSGIFTSFYQNPGSFNGGSSFSGLEIPVLVQGNISAIGSVSVSLTNSAGTSNVVSIQP